jgi:hypothetical protein
MPNAVSVTRYCNKGEDELVLLNYCQVVPGRQALASSDNQLSTEIFHLPTRSIASYIECSRYCFQGTCKEAERDHERWKWDCKGIVWHIISEHPTLNHQTFSIKQGFIDVGIPSISTASSRQKPQRPFLLGNVPLWVPVRTQKLERRFHDGRKCSNRLCTTFRSARARR